MSGAGVVASGFVLGVVRSHNVLAGSGSLTVTPIDAIASLADPARTALWSALGVDDPGALVVLHPSGWTAVAEANLKVGLTAAGTLPPPADADLYDLGVRVSPYRGADDPYVARPRFDAEVDRALAIQRVVLVVGPPVVGKSRLLAEAVRRLDPVPVLLAPLSQPNAVSTLLRHPDLAAVTAGRRVVLWLDQVGTYFHSLSGLHNGLLASARAAGVDLVVAATLTDQEYERLARSDNLPQAQAFLQQTDPVWIDDTLEPEERAAAALSYPDEDFDGGAGIAEQLVAARALRDRFHHASDTQRALVQAATDRQRAGLTRPVPRPQLIALAVRYLAESRRTRPARAHDVEAEIDWACTPIARYIALLREVDEAGESCFVPDDYLPTFLDGHGRPDGRPLPIPDHCWAAVLDQATDVEVLDVGLAALVRRNGAVAEAAGRRAAGSDDGDVALLGLFPPRAGGFRAGRSTAPRGAGNRQFLEAADAAGELDLAPVAQLNLGVVSTRTGSRKR